MRVRSWPVAASSVGGDAWNGRLGSGRLASLACNLPVYFNAGLVTGLYPDAAAGEWRGEFSNRDLASPQNGLSADLRGLCATAVQ